MGEVLCSSSMIRIIPTQPGSLPSEAGLSGIGSKHAQAAGALPLAWAISCVYYLVLNYISRWWWFIIQYSQNFSIQKSD